MIFYPGAKAIASVSSFLEARLQAPFTQDLKVCRQLLEKRR